MANLFQGARHSLQYSLFRPTYPPEVYQTIVQFCRQGPCALSLALDLGCGNGQSTFPLAKYFTRVRGSDPSENQIKVASDILAKKKKLEEGFSGEVVSFEVGHAEDLSEFSDGSVDLITLAQAVHWVDTDKFYPQVQRVLSPGGVLAAYGYGNVKVNNEEANAIIWKFYKEEVGVYWDSRRHHIDNHLSEICLPLQDFTRVDTLQINKEMTISDFIGYISTWSAYQTFLKKSPGLEILQKLQQRLCEAYHTDKPQHTTLHARWPIFMLLGRQSHSSQHS